MRRLLVVIAVLAVAVLWGGPAMAGEWHSGQSLVCNDCHTIHFSMQHKWISGDPVSSPTPAPGGDWLGGSGPNKYLLKAPANQLCMACHDGQAFAPDVLATNSNAAPTQGRQAGALNNSTVGAPYDTWKGHTLDSTENPPGFDPTRIGASATWYDPLGGLECTSCHAQHGPAAAYRNLGPFALGGAASKARPTYVIGAANDTTKDVWITSLGTGTVGNRTAAEFNAYYDSASVSFNRNDDNSMPVKSSNRIATFCAACHGQFHGGASDANIGATPAALHGFLRHPTSQVVIGAARAQGYGGTSDLARFVGATTKVKVAASDRVAWADAVPMCVTCHKGHGNKNPFGLIFLNRNAAAVDEEGGLGASQIASTALGLRNLCGQCHVQGN